MVRSAAPARPSRRAGGHPVLLMLASLLLMPTAGATDTQQRRPLQVNDIFEMEGIGHAYGGPFAFSVDGKSLSFTRLRPRKTLINHQREFLLNNDRADVWMQLAAGEPVINLTQGEREGSGWWAPQWSADGQWLAMLSTRDGRVTLWGWRKASQQLIQLSEREVELQDYDRPPFLWLSNSQILLPAASEQSTRAVIETDLEATPRLAGAGWRDAATGVRSTVSALYSGESSSSPQRAQGQLLVIDIERQQTKVLAERSTTAWTAAPNGRAVAFARDEGVYVPSPDEPLPLRRITPTGALATWSVSIHSSDGSVLVETAGITQNVLPESIRWSADGKELAFIGLGSFRREGWKLFRVQLSTRQVVEVPLGALDLAVSARSAAQLHWLPSGEIMLPGALRKAGTALSVSARRDWWVIARDGRQRCLTAGMSSPPRELWAGKARVNFFGLADGAIWRIAPMAGTISNVTGANAKRVESIEWPQALGWDDRAEYHFAGQTFTDLFFHAREDGASGTYRLELSSGRIAAVNEPGVDANVAAFASRTGTLIQAVEGDNGTAIWRTARGAPEVLMQANTFLRRVAGGELRSIEYRSLNGQSLRAWLILPTDYVAGRRYPLLTWVHAGYIAGSQPAYYHKVSYADGLNLHLAAAQGYAVLLPSMPVRTPGDADDVMLNLANGVTPAVQQAVSLGIADSSRVFLAGHSFGGYATYGLIAQTQMFKAAASLAGATNLTSQYGAFDPRLRYGDFPHQNLTNVTRMERGQSNLGAPPWGDIERYRQNSPINQVERIVTPLLIVQGDLDFVPIQQGEEMFMSLYRLGRRAQFARYWGEGHELRSPANIRDMWSRMVSWFDEFGDIARDDDGRILFDGEYPRSRGSVAPSG